MIRRDASKRKNLFIHAYAARLQQHLGIPVEVCELYPGGSTQLAKECPSSLVTIHPFCPGGTRRLVLNPHSKLIQELASANSSNSKSAAASIDMAQAMVWTSSWPINVECGDLVWKMARGLICGPQWNLVNPVPHGEMEEKNKLAVWPLRIYAVLVKPHKNLRQDSQEEPIIQLTYLGDKWRRREELLWKEWRSIKATKKKKKQAKRTTIRLATSNNMSFITYSPSLPVLLLAQYLQGTRYDADGGVLRCLRTESLQVAAKVLLSVDKLFCLSVFFGVPLMDRTQTLSGAVRVHHIVKPPPSSEEVESYRSRCSKDALTALQETMKKRARAIWNKNKRVLLCWSGGIDSTAALVSLLQTANENPASPPLRIVLTNESIQENPTFYENHIQGRLDCIDCNGKTLSEMAKEYENDSVIVTGELGDQLFGSDRCQSAFETKLMVVDPNLPPTALENPVPEPSFQSLSTRWEDELLSMLEERGLLCGSAKAWIDFFTPQLQKAPFAIYSLYDMLWWLNFSCKWQNVSLRYYHDGGQYRPSVGSSAVAHFYEDRELECWASVPEFHKCKFPDLNDWKSYKMPLKDIIHSFDGDDEYRKNKTKIGSLTFDLGETERCDNVDRILGLVQTADGSVAEVVSGVSSIKELSAEDLSVFVTKDGASINNAGDLLEPWILETNESQPPMKIPTLHIFPWTKAGAFEVAKQFAEHDARQRRVGNPVTAITLHGKCSALLPPELVCDKTVVDIGACLGAMCHWSLYYGAAHAVGVEPQRDFCTKMDKLLQDASSTWPASEQQDRFSVVCAEAQEFLSGCNDQSFDVAVVAGVLHCFQDPIAVLQELARVTKHAVCIESVHTTYHVSGFQEATQKPLSLSTGLLELAPSASVNKAGEDASFTGMAVVASESLIRNFMNALGFDVTRVLLSPHPTHNVDVLTYTGCRRFQASPIRFFLRCTRRQQVVQQMQSLQDCVVSGAGGERQWASSQRKFWTSYNMTHGARVNDNAKEGEVNRVGKTSLVQDKQQIDNGVTNSDVVTGTWEFDDAVARRFRNEAESHIPDYCAVIDTCLEAVEGHFGKAELPRLHAVDVGCAIGYTVIEMLQFGIGHVYGYDVSSSMLREAEQNVKQHAVTHNWDTKNVEVFLAKEAKEVPLRFSPSSLDAVLMNWTLHFIVKAEERLHYLGQLFEALKPGGLLLLTEKTTQNDATRDMYYAWKASPPQNVSPEIIQAKREKLKGVLETLPVDWYLQALETCGFANISVLRAKFGFVTFLCNKPEVSTQKSASDVALDPFHWWPHVELDAHKVWFDGSADPEPYQLKAWGDASGIMQQDPLMSSFGYVQSGEAILSRTLGKVIHKTTLIQGMYFSCHGCFGLKGGSGFLSMVPHGLGTTQPTPFLVGGPIEADADGAIMQGRLPYIDGCSDSLLIPPVIKGAPCLNHLHFPPNIIQTQHTHPSGRTGIVVQGRGICRLVSSGDGVALTVPLEPGTVFCIPRELPHAFETSTGECMDVVAFHPDSDFGPTPTNHPMVNRTIVNGISASFLPSIQTKKQ